jgi:hypothetical protein
MSASRLEVKQVTNSIGLGPAALDQLNAVIAWALSLAVFEKV